MIDGIEFKDLTFEQFTRWATRELLDALIAGGMEGVRVKLYTILPAYAAYQKARKDAS